MASSPGRRQVQGSRRKPPEASRAEASYLLQAVESGAMLVIQLLGGQEIRGKLEYYDRDSLKIEQARGRKILLRRDKIKYYRAEQPEDA